MNSESPRKPPLGFLRQFALAVDLPFILVGSTLVGGAAGYLFDHWLHTSPVLALLLGALGFAAGLRELLRRLIGKDRPDGRG